jgi:pimeloyl-ACP methyl ester carboxylesterase
VIIAVDGVELHVEVEGSGPALVLVNGAFCTMRQWDGVVDHLAESFRIIHHDVRGTGRSGPGPGDGYTFERYADDIAAILDQLGESRAHLWGMAWGARVALVAAAHHPSRFDRLLLSDLGIDPAAPEAQKVGPLAAKESRAAAGIAEVARPDGWNTHDDPEEAVKALAATRLHRDLMPFVESVEVPALIATGDHDPNLVSRRRALAGFADARLEVLPHTGHGSVMQRPDLIAPLALEFLRG